MGNCIAFCSPYSKTCTSAELLKVKDLFNPKPAGTPIIEPFTEHLGKFMDF